MRHNEDEFERRLRRELAEQASAVRPSGDGLARIRDRVQDRPARWWRPVLAGVAAAAVVAAMATGGVLLLGNDEPDPVVAVAPTPTTAPPLSPAPQPSSTPSGTAPASAYPADLCHPPPTPAQGPGVAPTPVYWVADVAGELRLYREFAGLPGVTARCGAVQEALTGTPADPDYATLWPADSTVQHLTVDGTTATVDLSAAAARGTASAEQTSVSVQQLVYTVTAVDPRVKAVRLTVDGRPVDTLWGHPIGTDPIERAPMLDVQGLIWIIDPAEGAQTGSPVTVRVYGTAFEGNVVLQVFRGATQVEGTFVTTAMGEFAEASTQIKLDPGTYEIRAYDESGPTGQLTERDSKAFTVR